MAVAKSLRSHLLVILLAIFVLSPSISRGETTTAYVLNRTTAGRVFFDDFDDSAFSNAHWSHYDRFAILPGNDPGGKEFVAGGWLRVLSGYGLGTGTCPLLPGGDCFGYYLKLSLGREGDFLLQFKWRQNTPLAPPKACYDSHIQVVITKLGESGTLTTNVIESSREAQVFGTNQLARFDRYVSGVFGGSPFRDNSALNSAASGTVTVYRVGSTFYGKYDGNLISSVADGDGSLPGDFIGDVVNFYLGSAQVLGCTSHQTTSSFVADFDYFALTSSHLITIAGLASGQKVRLYDMSDSLVAEATASSTAVLDVSGATSAHFKLFEITDTDGTTILYRTSPSESFYTDIWGGDVYQWATQPGEPVGGVLMPSSSLALLGPYLALVGIVGVVAMAVATKRRREA